MNDEQKQVIRKEIEKHIEEILSDREMAKRESDMFGTKRLLRYMESSTASKSFFDNTDVDDLMSKYEEELIRVSEILGNSTFSSKQKMLNFFEYIRMSGMYENIDMSKFFIPGTVSAISQSGINIALLGKGVCASQASFLRDLLITSGEDAITKKVYFIDEDGMIEDQHLVTYACSSNDGANFFLDPTWYNGTINSLEGSFNSADIPALLEDLDKEEVIKLFRILPKEQAGEAFSYMDPYMKEKLIQDLTDAELKNILDELFMDDTVDLIEEMPSNVVKKILRAVNKQDRKVINELLQYPEDSAGSIMTTEFVDLKETMTVEQALQRIRDIGIDSETIYNCYVLNSNRILLGTVNIKEILISKPTTIIKNLMATNIISINTTDDKEEVTKLFDKYDYFALPVVDNENRLVGIVTVDDAINVIQDEVSEDFEKMAAISPNEDGYFKTSVFKHAKNRILWLLILMLSATITGGIITKYEEAFATVPLLVAFIPMIMGTGGNCGSQSSTLIIRGLATDEIKLNDVFRALWKEFRVSVIVGIILAIVNAIRILILYKNSQLALVIGFTLIATVMLAKALGCLLPLLAKRFKLDPAIMASPLITTLVDIFSILVYFQIATAIMGL